MQKIPVRLKRLQNGQSKNNLHLPVLHAHEVPEFVFNGKKHKNERNQRHMKTS